MPDLEKLIRNWLNSPNLTAPQQQTLKKFEKYQREERQSSLTRRNYVCVLGRLGKGLKTPFEEISKEELSEYVLQLRETYKAATGKKYIQMISRFFKWMYDPNDLDFPDLVKGPIFREKKGNTKAGDDNSNGLSRDDLLTSEEIEAIIEVVENPMYKALYGMMIDSGGRIAREVLQLTIGDVKLEPSKKQYKVTLAEREVLCIRSYPLVTLWMDMHRNRKDPTAPLFHSEWKPSNSLPAPTVRNHLQADVALASKQCPSLKGKRVYPHLFRHTAATGFAAKPGVSDFIMNQRFGWKQGSKMAGIYIHLASSDVEDITRMAFGAEPIGQIESQELLDYVRVSRSEFQEFQEFKEGVESGELAREMVDEAIQTQLNTRMEQIDAREQETQQLLTAIREYIPNFLENTAENTEEES